MAEQLYDLSADPTERTNLVDDPASQPALADFFHGRRPPIATAEEGRLAVQSSLAARRSLETGEVVRL